MIWVGARKATCETFIRSISANKALGSKLLVSSTALVAARATAGSATMPLPWDIGAACATTSPGWMLCTSAR